MLPSTIRWRHNKAGKGVKERETIQETDRENVNDLWEMISAVSVIIIIRALNSTC